MRKKVPIGRVSDAVDAASTTAVSTMVKKCFTGMIDGIDNGKFTDHVMVGPCLTPGFLANQVIAAAMAPLGGPPGRTTRRRISKDTRWAASASGLLASGTLHASTALCGWAICDLAKAQAQGLQALQLPKLKWQALAL